jgi:hypothetical protein
MSGIQPQTLSNDELEKYVYLMLSKKEPIPAAWVAVLLERFTKLMDEVAAH